MVRINMMITKDKGQRSDNINKSYSRREKRKKQTFRFICLFSLSSSCGQKEDDDEQMYIIYITDAMTLYLRSHFLSHISLFISIDRGNS